jgi:hypothetical protein
MTTRISNNIELCYDKMLLEKIKGPTILSLQQLISEIL